MIIYSILFLKKTTVHLELVELLGSTLGLGDLDNVETDGLGKGTALTNGNNITANGSKQINKYLV
jgi:hypothetical protein